MIVPVSLIFSACMDVTAPSGPERHESRAVDLDKSERVRVELNMKAGELSVQGGAQKLMEADFIYNSEAAKPDVRYRSFGTAGDLVLEQHGASSTSKQSRNRWDLRFHDQVPLDFRVEFGAGEAELKLGSLNLRGVELRMGAGSLRMDLRGSPSKDYSVRIRGGVGEATVYLPKDVNISATASGGIGEISVTGLEKRGDRYVNDVEAGAARIRLDVQGGVGSIRLIAE